MCNFVLVSHSGIIVVELEKGAPINSIVSSGGRFSVSFALAARLTEDMEDPILRDIAKGLLTPADDRWDAKTVLTFVSAQRK